MAHAFIAKNIRDTLPLEMSFATATLASRIALGLLANSIRGKATSRSSKPDSPPKRKAQTEQVRFGFFLAENQRFELWNRVTGYTISNRAPSTS